MIEMFRQQMEREYSLEEARALAKVQSARRRTIAHYFILASAAIIGFALLSTASNSDIGKLRYLCWALAIAVLAVGEQARTNQSAQDFVSTHIARVFQYFDFNVKSDFLWWHFWASLLLLWAPLLWGLGKLWPLGPLVAPTDPLFAVTKEISAQALNYYAGLLGAQLTLFTFILSTVLGRYSSRLAGTIIRHRAIISVVAFGLIALAVLGFSQLWGLPSSMLGLPRLLTVLCLPALVISVFLTLDCIQTQGAILYFGKTEAFRLRRQFKPPWPTNDHERPFWKVLMYYGLYLKSIERSSPLSIPQSSINQATVACRTLFNAANISLQEGQDEIFEASLTSVIMVAAGYTEGRTKYFSSEDPFFSFLNNQMAAVISAAAKAPNQSLISTATRKAGILALLSLKIGHLPKSEQDDGRVAKGHSLVLYWIGLLKESFLESHTLLRTTAPFESLDRLRAIAFSALESQLAEVASLTYLSTLKEIHGTCLAEKGSYYPTLASRCLRDVLSVWYYPILRESCGLGIHHIHKQMAAAVLDMAAKQLISKPDITFDFSDVPNTLTGKTSSESILLQDIFFALAHRPHKEGWEQRTRIEQLKEVLSLTVQIGCLAAASDHGLAQNFSTALYEMAYLVFRGIPGLPTELQADLEDHIFKSWGFLYTCQSKSSGIVAHQSSQEMFAILGMAASQYSVTPKESLKTLLQSTMRLVLTRVQDKAKKDSSPITDDDWEYLQLLGSWARNLIADNNLADEVATLVATKPSRGIWGGSSTPLGSLGYPTVFHADFHFPNLRNIRAYVNRAQWEQFGAMQERALSENQLASYAREIRAVRDRARSARSEQPPAPDLDPSDGEATPQ